MGPEPRVVLDTNVFVAAGFNPQSSSASILGAVERGELRTIWDDATRSEIEHVLRQIPRLSNREMARFFRDEDRFTGPTAPADFDEVPDPDDRKFAALARAAGAVLVTNDEHLLASGVRGVTVLKPGEFWKLHESGGTP